MHMGKYSVVHLQEAGVVIYALKSSMAVTNQKYSHRTAVKLIRSFRYFDVNGDVSYK